jgi:hypothetical protein
MVVMRSGRKFVVEPLKGAPVQWGDVNPATGKVEGSYGSKYEGGVDPKDSILKPENGFKNITKLPPGVSPLNFIERIDASGVERIDAYPYED